MMDFKKTALLLMLSFVLLVPARAQYDVHFTHYWAMQSYYNPAASGSAEKLSLAGTYAKQLSGFENSPNSMFIGADLPLTFVKECHAAGAGILNENIGMFTNQHLYLQYAYRLKLWGGRLGVGAQVGLLNETFDPKGLEFGGDANDPAFPSASVNGNKMDFGAGLYYRRKGWWGGLSVLHAMAPKILLGETNEMQIDPLFYFAAGCNIRLKNPLLSIQPSLQVMSDLVSTRADFTLRGSYLYREKLFYAGLTYSPSTSVAFLLGGCINSISFGYAYELFTTGVGASNGSHDLFVGYTMDLDLFKKGKNKHTSIRVL